MARERQAAPGSTPAQTPDPDPRWAGARGAEPSPAASPRRSAGPPGGGAGAADTGGDARGALAARLQRAERLGHDVTRVLTGLRRRPRTTVQRRPWLDNEAAGIYRDANLGIDLAFVTTQSTHNFGVFIPHANLQALRDLIGPLVTGASAVMRAGPQVILSQISNGFQHDASDLRAAAGRIFIEEGRNLVEVPGGDLAPGIVLALVQLGAQDNPRIRNEGGGSRLPEAEGNLYVDRTHFRDKSAVLTALGIPAEKLADYGRVREVLVDSFAEASRRAEVDRGAGANVIAGRGFIYASTVVARRSPGRRFAAAGRNYDETFSTVPHASPALGTLTASYESIAGPGEPAWVGDLAGGREGDQNTVMDDWGALGAAAFHNRFRLAHGAAVPLDQNWEWLHVRGAQIGGETEQGNLLAGTFAANSAMIPFESQIQRWHRGNHGRIFARFSARVRDRILAERITIEIATVDHPDLGTIPREAPLTVEFFPLEGRVIDKLTGQVQQAQFREQAEGRRREFQVRLGQLTEPERPLPAFGRERGEAPRELVPFGGGGPSALGGEVPSGGLVLTTTSSGQSLEGSLGDVFGSALRSADPVARLSPLFQLMARHGFSIELPDLGVLFAPEALARPDVLFRSLGRARRPVRRIARDPSSFVETGEDLSLVRAGAKRPLEELDPSLLDLRIKIHRPNTFRPDRSTPIALPSLPPLLLPLLLPPPPRREAERESSSEEDADL